MRQRQFEVGIAGQKRPNANGCFEGDLFYSSARFRTACRVDVPIGERLPGRGRGAARYLEHRPVQAGRNQSTWPDSDAFSVANISR
jgi:hypothetical protein